ncbi:MAG: WecB/TagA/CpsF family glycosyltransferase [Clostridia bacterium]|nr:WecB/TagA/CpsF family glycosyltransferase [Clostridia bacterium]
MNKIDIRGVAFDNVTMDEAVEICEGFVRDGRQGVVFTPNSEIVQMTLEDEDFGRLVNSADLIIPDGAGVVLASKILKKKLRGKVAGVELAEKLVSRSGESGVKFFFYGSSPTAAEGRAVAEVAREKLLEKYPDAQIVGTNHGFVKEDGMDALVDKINESGADALFVCLGVPRQEKWICANRHRLNPKIIIGLGGSLDVFAGTVQRAPKIFIKLNLEWFYRLLKEPKRLGRMMKIPKFLISTVLSRKG